MVEKKSQAVGSEEKPMVFRNHVYKKSDGGKGANLRFENMSARKWGSIIFSLFFFAPIKFVLLEFFVAIKTVIVFLAIVKDLLFGGNSSSQIENAMVKASIAMFNMDKSQIEVFQK